METFASKKVTEYKNGRLVSVTYYPSRGGQTNIKRKYRKSGRITTTINIYDGQGRLVYFSHGDKSSYFDYSVENIVKTFNSDQDLVATKLYKDSKLISVTSANFNASYGYDEYGRMIYKNIQNEEEWISYSEPDVDGRILATSVAKNNIPISTTLYDKNYNVLHYKNIITGFEKILLYDEYGNLISLKKSIAGVNVSTKINTYQNGRLVLSMYMKNSNPNYKRSIEYTYYD